MKNLKEEKKGKVDRKEKTYCLKFCLFTLSNGKEKVRKRRKCGEVRRVMSCYKVR